MCNTRSKRAKNMEKMKKCSREIWPQYYLELNEKKQGENTTWEKIRRHRKTCRHKKYAGFITQCSIEKNAGFNAAKGVVMVWQHLVTTWYIGDVIRDEICTILPTAARSLFPASDIFKLTCRKVGEEFVISSNYRGLILSLYIGILPYGTQLWEGTGKNLDKQVGNKIRSGQLL